VSASYRWYVIGLLTAIAALNYADRAVMAALLPLMRTGLGMSDMMLGTLGAVFLWSYAIGSPATGWLSDRLPRVRIVVGSLAVWSAATVLSGCAASAGQMLLTRLLLGLSQCAYFPAAVALIASFQPARQRALAIGIALAGCNLGFIVGGFLGGYSGDHFGWRPVFFLLGGAGLALAGVAAITLRPLAAREKLAARQPAAAAPGRLRELLRVRSYLIVLLESSCLSVPSWVFLSWLPFYFHETYGLTLTGAALAGTVAIQIAATCGYGFGGYISDRFAGVRRERRMLLQSRCFFIAAPFVLVFASGGGIALISVCLFIASLFRGIGSTNDQVLICEVLPPNLRATALGLMNGVNIATGSVGVLLAGYLLRRIPLAAMFAAMAVFFVGSAIITQIGYRRYLRSDLLALPPAV
jgi:predicted MFS family arabinose efflux permease